MPAPPLVSVIIATNRAGEFLDEALRSVAAQTYPAWEVVIVDDGGPAPAEIDAIAAAHPRTRVIHQGPAGVSVARNVGVGESTGELCAFLDDDDLWMPDRLALQVAALEADEGAVVAYGRIASIDETGRVTSPADQTGAPDIHALFDGSGLPQFQTVLVRRRSLLRVGGFHSALRYAEDLDLLLRLAREGSFVFVDAEVARYRRHGANVTAAYRPLVRSVDAVLRLQMVRAEGAADGTAADLRTRERANGRYAFWRAGQRPEGAGSPGRLAALGWAVRFAPLAPVDAVLRRLRRR